MDYEGIGREEHMRKYVLLILLVIIVCSSCARKRVIRNGAVHVTRDELRVLNQDPNNKENNEERSLPSSKEAPSLYELSKMTNQDKEIILSRRSYTLSYNPNTKLPNWVAWHLTAEHTDGEIGRSNDYREDIDVPTPRATIEDYKGSIWSRGHMCPAGDNKWDRDAMSETFLLTNICPQHASLNSGLWNRIEQDCRRWAKEYGEVYIVCGPVFLNKEHETIGVNKIVVPEAFFKVILCIKGKPKAIGFIVRNNEGTKKKDQFVNTVDDVERITGIDFFPSLPDEIENEVEAYSNLEDWK